MDFTLRCNSLKCRTQLADRAVVTTCSHIFCVPCSNSLGLSSPSAGLRICPACETQLSNPDDAVLTQLNPTEDYKTSVLSGLSPSTIMECSSRGIAFFHYQTTQEIMYQDYMAKNLTDKYATLSSQMDNVIKDANSEIMNLRDKLSTLHSEKKDLENKNNELGEAFKEKSRAQQRLQQLYQKLKARVGAVQVEDAAAHDVDNLIQSVSAGQFAQDYQVPRVPQKPQTVHTRGQDMYAAQRGNSSYSGGRGQFSWETQVPGAREGGLYSSQGVAAATPSHRSRLGMPGYDQLGTGFAGHDREYARAGTRIPRPTPARQALGNIDPNVMPNAGMSGYGMSAGAKVGSQQGGGFSRARQMGGVR